jgi:hypothetical protein
VIAAVVEVAAAVVAVIEEAVAVEEDHATTVARAGTCSVTAQRVATVLATSAIALAILLASAGRRESVVTNVISLGTLPLIALAS